MWLVRNQKSRHIFMTSVSSFVSLKYALVFILIRSLGGDSQNTLQSHFFQTFLLFPTTPCLLLASPTLLVYEGDWRCWAIFWGTVGGLQSISYLMWVSFTRRKNNNNSANTFPAQLDSSSMHWLLKSCSFTSRGDSTQRIGQGLWRPVKHTLPFLKNIPAGNNLAFPAKHELARQSD